MSHFSSPVTIGCYLDSGDRTPKQKVKLKVTEEKLLNLMLKYNGGRARSEVVLESPLALLLWAPYALIICLPFSSLDVDKAEKCCPVARFIRCHTNSSTP